MSNSLVVIPAGLPAAARCWLTVFFNFHCTIGNLKLSLGFQVMKSTSLSWSFVYRNVRCGNEWTIDALRLKHKILISDVSSSSTWLGSGELEFDLFLVVCPVAELDSAADSAADWFPDNASGTLSMLPASASARPAWPWPPWRCCTYLPSLLKCIGISSSEFSGINLAVVTALLVLSFGYA